MVVSELIEKLKEFDPKSVVLVSGYEFGLEDDFTVTENIVKIGYNAEEMYGGCHEKTDKEIGHADNIVNAVCIER